MFLAIIFGTPIWVWPLLAFLIGYGIRASRDRDTSVWPVYLVPLLGLITLKTIITAPGGQSVWIAYVAAYALAAVAGFGLQRRWLVEKHDRRVTLKGEWLTFAVVMILFWSNFAYGVTRAIAPDVITQVSNQVVYAVVVAFASGSLLGRALQVALAPSAAMSPVPAE
ncbi:hypothetical protein OS190_13315 [Sulfitobacter sp. F26204]|uniref:hypothetical protein n=1 Tax=Sulfitobacter sp. F26204 TaxID=2996014 RepID=UPI00225E2C1B|nr:hypothetical protein [Sulfitobacter sp. F26204]MCX7560550.1 hypothetical protein [Sulfitobacter sp. F26204]